MLAVQEPQQGQLQVRQQTMAGRHLKFQQQLGLRVIQKLVWVSLLAVTLIFSVFEEHVICSQTIAGGHCKPHELVEHLPGGTPSVSGKPELESVPAGQSEWNLSHASASGRLIRWNTACLALCRWKAPSTAANS